MTPRAARRRHARIYPTGFGQPFIGRSSALWMQGRAHYRFESANRPPVRRDRLAAVIGGRDCARIRLRKTGNFWQSRLCEIL